MVRSRLFAIAGVVSIGLLTTGCETSDIMDKMHDFNPFGTAKTPLPGERRAVFPEGVPGVQQGVPPEMMRGAPRQAALEPEPLDAPPQQAAPKRAEKPKPKPPKPRVAQPRPPRPAPPPEAVEQQAPARARPAAAPAAQPGPAAQSAPAAQPAPAPAAAAPWTPPPASPPLTVWPDPPKPGTFSR
jgi:hypothetical protein